MIGTACQKQGLVRGGLSEGAGQTGMQEELEVTSKVRLRSRGTDSPGEEAPAIHYPTKAFPFSLIWLHCAESTEKERVQPHLADGFAQYGALPLYSQTLSSPEGKA